MNGAREFSLLMNTGQHGRLFISSGHHARGRTFHVWVLPFGEVVREGCWPSKDAVEVYGIIGGQPGWTESYGWLRAGPWQKDFEALVAARRVAIAEAKREREEQEQAVEREKTQRAAAVLATYAPYGDSHGS